jgi:hypothetical protein
MATGTVGTNANNTLTALTFLHGMTQADLATMAAAILDDRSPAGGSLANAAPSAKPTWPGAFTTQGKLYIPNRGLLEVLPGDVVAIDANGWPILLSANAIAGGGAPSAVTSWTHAGI